MVLRRQIGGIQVVEVYAEIDLAVVSILDEALDEAIVALKDHEPEDGRVSSSAAPAAKGWDPAPGVPNPVEANAEDGGPVVVLNLCPIDFLDSQGIRSLIGYRTALNELGGDMIVAAQPGEVMRILRMTGVDELFRVFDSLEGALAAAKSR